MERVEKREYNVTDVIGRMKRLEVYNKILKSPYKKKRDLARELEMDLEDVEIYVASLRKMYKEGKIDKYVIISDEGYYLKDNIVEVGNIFKDDIKNPSTRIEKDKILVLDLKRQSKDSIELVKLNVIDENDNSTFSLTISLNKKTMI